MSDLAFVDALLNSRTYVNVRSAAVIACGSMERAAVLTKLWELWHEPPAELEQGVDADGNRMIRVSGAWLRKRRGFHFWTARNIRLHVSALEELGMVRLKPPKEGDKDRTNWLILFPAVIAQVSRKQLQAALDAETDPDVRGLIRFDIAALPGLSDDGKDSSYGGKNPSNDGKSNSGEDGKNPSANHIEKINSKQKSADGVSPSGAKKPRRKRDKDATAAETKERERRPQDDFFDAIVLHFEASPEFLGSMIAKTAINIYKTGLPVGVVEYVHKWIEAFAWQCKDGTTRPHINHIASYFGQASSDFKKGKSIADLKAEMQRVNSNGKFPQRSGIVATVSSAREKFLAATGS